MSEKIVKYMYSKMRTHDTDVKENSSKNCLIDRMIAKKFKYHDRPVLQVVYVSHELCIVITTYTLEQAKVMLDFWRLQEILNN